MPPTILSLPSELKHEIAELCSPNTLASLARTHTACQIEAEQTLYRSLTLHYPYDDKCLETLAKNSKKAAYVRTLQVDDRKRRTLHLMQALINMHSLHDLRLRMNLYEPGADAWIKELETILCGSHFQLHTLYCHDTPRLSVSRIFKSQTELKVFGIYNLSYPYTLLETLKQFRDAQLSLPMVFTVESDYVSQWHIGIFPGFYNVDRIATMQKVLSESLDKDAICAGMNEVVSQLSIYLVDSSDLPTIRALSEDMAVIFPRLAQINFSFEHRWKIPPQEMKGVLSSFSNLRHLTLCLWNHRPNRNAHHDRRANVKEWKIACPQLASLFINGLLYYTSELRR